MPTDRAGHRDDGRPSDRSSGRDQPARDHVGDPAGGERSVEHAKRLELLNLMGKYAKPTTQAAK